METWTLTLEFIAVLFTVVYIARLLLTFHDSDEIGFSYSNIKRSLLNQHIRKRV